MRKIVTRLFSVFLFSMVIMGFMAIRNNAQAIMNYPSGLVCPSCGGTTIRVEGQDVGPCGETWNITYYCENCWDSWTKPVTFQHRWEKIDEKKATCTEDGSITYVCHRNYYETPDSMDSVTCNDTRTETIKAKGHKYKKQY